MEDSAIDLGNDDLNQLEITDTDLPDRRFTEMGKKMEEEESKNDESTFENS
jgi:hypothetical protein